MPDPYEPFHQVVETLALLRGVGMILMVGTFSTPILLHWIYFNRFWSFEIRQISGHGKEFVVGDGEGGQANLAWLWLSVSPFSNLP